MQYSTLQYHEGIDRSLQAKKQAKSEHLTCRKRMNLKCKVLSSSLWVNVIPLLYQNRRRASVASCLLVTCRACSPSHLNLTFNCSFPTALPCRVSLSKKKTSNYPVSQFPSFTFHLFSSMWRRVHCVQALSFCVLQGEFICASIITSSLYS